MKPELSELIANPDLQKLLANPATGTFTMPVDGELAASVGPGGANEGRVVAILTGSESRTVLSRTMNPHGRTRIGGVARGTIITAMFPFVIELSTRDGWQPIARPEFKPQPNVKWERYPGI